MLRAMWPACTQEGLSEALDALQEIPTAQRLGALMALDGQDQLAALVARWLQGKPMRLVSLESKQAIDASTPVDANFKVRLPLDLRNSNT
ncbi:hypothetical protein ACU4GI_46260 (plasmid) [Cupriavidus basilensis]